MRAAAPGLTETGAPAFVVIGPEALGLSSSPRDLHILPDGRVLVVSQQELAFGDGVRWETYRARDSQAVIFGTVAVGGDGQVYTGIQNGMARIELIEGARWHMNLVTELPTELAAQQTTLVYVAMYQEQWYWYGGSGAIVSWRPGEAASLVGNASAIDRIFPLGPEVYASDQSSGGLFRLKAGGVKERVQTAEMLVSEGVSAVVPFGPGEVLIGTASAGLKLFNGQEFTPFGPPGLLNSGHRVTDLCAVGEGRFAAAIDTVGIVFFDRTGRIDQVLDRSLDHRLARVQRLRYTRDGMLWAMLTDGVARVEYPSPISHYEPFLASGLNYAQPLRHAGRLWILADGRAMRGQYDGNGRLESFTDDTPRGRYLFTLTDVDGELFASNEEGIHVYQDGAWKLVLPGIVNARIGAARPGPGARYYVARGEFGTILSTPEGYTARRIPRPELGDSYNAEIDAEGVGWIELGVSRVGRLEVLATGPSLEIFDGTHGLLNGWMEIYLLDGIARFHVGDQLYRFDAATRRFLADQELLARHPQLARAGGRPVTDNQGRLWFTQNGATQVIDRTATGGNQPVAIPRSGFVPTSYTVEDDGVIWMFEARRLARLDLRLPKVELRPPRALITSVELPASSRQIFGPGGSLSPLDYVDNTLVIRFAAPANPFASPLTFEVQLEGAGNSWVSTGAVGSATFNRLKEGDYQFRVRPVVAGVGPGGEARLAFTVRPPWYRTPLAWVLYGAAALGLLVFVTWFSSYLHRRENERLELLVNERTSELHATNEQLGRQIAETMEKSAALSASEERYRSLNTELEQRVQTRTAELSRSNVELQQRELLFRLIFEHAPVGISWKRTDLGELYHLNPTFCRILGLPGATLADYTELAMLVHPDDAPRQTEMNRCIASGETDRYKLEERFVLKDGRQVWALLSVAVIRDQTRRIIQEIGILEDVTARKEAEVRLADTHRQLVDASRQAGMAEVATGVLHNVGNVLNSVNVSATLIDDRVRRTKATNIAKLAALLDEHKTDLGGFLTRDARGQSIPGYLATLSETLATERTAVLDEVEHLRVNIEHIKDIVSMQQAYARTSGVTQTIAVPDLLDEVLRINTASFSRHAVEIVRDFQGRPVVAIDKHKVMQILINLMGNAKQACDEAGRADKRIVVRMTSDERTVRIAIVDNGVGIAAENLTRIFNHGFTTKNDGHGFGLHSGALAAKELGGALTVESAGAGQGATFILELPFKPVVPAP